MPEIDEFASALLEEAKALLEKSENAEVGKSAYLHSALILGFCSLEAHVNAIAHDFVETHSLSAPDMGVLTEREIRLDQGAFKLMGLRMYPLDERIMFLHERFTSQSLDRVAPWWSELASATKLRNQLTHPRSVPAITYIDVKRALSAIIAALDATYQALYQKALPVASRGLQAKFTL